MLRATTVIGAEPCRALIRQAAGREGIGLCWHVDGIVVDEGSLIITYVQGCRSHVAAIHALDSVTENPMIDQIPVSLRKVHP